MLQGSRANGTNRRAQVRRLVALALLVSALGCGDDAKPASLRDDGGPAGDAAPLPPDAAITDDGSVDGTAEGAAESGMPYGSVPSAGCGTGGIQPGTSVRQLLHGGSMRSFRVHVPQRYHASQPAPLVLLFHGGGGGGRQLQQASAKMDPIAEREGFLTVYPDGTGLLRTWHGGGCCGAAVNDQVDDVGFVAALLDTLEAELCIDRRRVYATGMSNGAILAHRLGCELAQRIAAIAPVAGTDMTSRCSPARPLPVMQIHGSDDGHVPWDGGRGCGAAGVAFTSVPTTIERWRDRNGCGGEASLSLEQGDGRCETTQCNGGAEVALCTIAGGSHSWPGGEPDAELVACPADGEQSTTFSASEAMWSFFSRHTLPLD